MVSDERRLQRSLVEALGYLELGLPHLAVGRLQRFADVGRDRLSWNLVMGEALRALQEYPEAIVLLERARQLAPERVDIYLSLGWCYKRTGQLPQAIQALQTALRLDPHNDLILYNLACYHCLAGHKSDTLNYLARALRIADHWRAHIPSESDFDSLRDDPDFQSLINPHG
jgi:tetratricopeptide (TPR) repeat protein